MLRVNKNGGFSGATCFFNMGYVMGSRLSKLTLNREPEIIERIPPLFFPTLRIRSSAIQTTDFHFPKKKNQIFLRIFCNKYLDKRDFS